MFTSPSQILCTLWGVNIYYYGVIMALAISAGVFVSEWWSYNYYKLKKETIVDLAPYLIIFGILGARLYYCILNYDFYLRFPTEILAIRHGGISIHGAMIGGIIGLVLFAQRHKQSIVRLCDISVIGLSIGQAIGRWGNFFNSEAFGSPTDLPWKLYVAPQYRPIPYHEYSYFHPAFLYESILDLVIFIVLIILLKTKKIKKAGSLTLIYLILYSLTRIFVESFRLDSVKYIHRLPIATFVSIVIIILTSIILVVRKKG